MVFIFTIKIFRDPLPQRQSSLNDTGSLKEENCQQGLDGRYHKFQVPNN